MGFVYNLSICLEGAINNLSLLLISGVSMPAFHAVAFVCGVIWPLSFLDTCLFFFLVSCHVV